VLLPRPTTANWANAATCNLWHELLRHARTCQDWLQTSHPVNNHYNSNPDTFWTDLIFWTGIFYRRLMPYNKYEPCTCTPLFLHLSHSHTPQVSKYVNWTMQKLVALGSKMTEYDFCIPPFQPPNGTAQGANSSNEKKAKVYEQLKTLRILFKRLRLIYEKCNENCQGMEYTHIEVLLVHIMKQ